MAGSLPPTLKAVILYRRPVSNLTEESTLSLAEERAAEKARLEEREKAEKEKAALAMKAAADKLESALTLKKSGVALQVCLRPHLITDPWESSLPNTPPRIHRGVGCGFNALDYDMPGFWKVFRKDIQQYYRKRSNDRQYLSL